MTGGQEGMLFDQQPPRPLRARKEIKPAYRPSRKSAMASREEYLAAWREHQPGCERCRTAWDRAIEAGHRPADEVCAVGYTAVMAAAGIEVGLRRGYYPDRDKAASVAPERAGVAEGLWG